MNEDMKLAVKHGAYYMDENYPGWATTIDFDMFDMSDCQQCIVGQAIGHYFTVISDASGQPHLNREAILWAIDHGFDVPKSAFDEGRVLDALTELEELWTEQVKDRLNG